MARQWVKEELKRDRLVEFLEKIVPFFKAHKDVMLIFGVILGVVIIVGIITQYRLKTEKENAQRSLAMGINFVRTGQAEHIEKGIQILNDVLTRYPKGNIGGYAYLYKGEGLYLQGKFQEAAGSFSLSLEIFRRNKNLEPLAIMDLAQTFEQSGKFQEAIDAAQQLINKYPRHSFVPSLQLLQARSYEAQGLPQNAVSIYQTVSSIYPGLYKDTADWRLFVLNQQGQQNR